MLYFCLFIYHLKHFIYVVYKLQCPNYLQAVHLISMATIESCYDFCLILDNLFLKELFKYGKHVETFYIDLKFSMQLRTYSLYNILVSGGQNCLHSMLRDTFMSGSYLIDPILLRT